MTTKIRRFTLGKLVRDNIEQFHLDSGAVLVTKRALSDSDFDASLRAKILEEAQEVFDAKTGDELVSECADVMEVMNALLVLNGKTWEEVVAMSDEKAATRGVFEKRVFIESVDLPADSEAAHYYGSNPEKYPELSVE